MDLRTELALDRGLSPAEADAAVERYAATLREVEADIDAPEPR